MSKIRRIVRIRQMLQRWRKKAALAARTIPCDVPTGHVAVTVGPNCKRFVVRTTYLNHPLFKKLLVEAEEEFGFTNTGPLAIPCDESLFREILSYLARSHPSHHFATLEDFQQSCRIGFRSHHDFYQPLLHDNSIW